jgi:hypothetical protein
VQDPGRVQEPDQAQERVPARVLEPVQDRAPVPVPVQGLTSAAQTHRPARPIPRRLPT